MRNRSRVTARIHRTEDGDLLHEYVVDGVAYPSVEAVERARGESALIVSR